MNSYSIIGSNNDDVRSLEGIIPIIWLHATYQNLILFYFKRIGSSI